MVIQFERITFPSTKIASDNQQGTSCSKLFKGLKSHFPTGILFFFSSRRWGPWINSGPWSFLLIDFASVGGICLLEINSCSDDMMRIEGKERILTHIPASQIGMQRYAFHSSYFYLGFYRYWHVALVLTCHIRLEIFLQAELPQSLGLIKTSSSKSWHSSSMAVFSKTNFKVLKIYTTPCFGGLFISPPWCCTYP